MRIEWIAAETLAVLVECFAYVYFLNSRFPSKYTSKIPQIGTWLVCVVLGLVVTFCKVPSLLFDYFGYGIILAAFLLFFKQGALLHKILSIVMARAIVLGITLMGAGLSSLITDTSLEHSRTHQDASRLLAIIIIKAIQVVVFYFLAKRYTDIRHLRKKPTLVLACATAISFLCLMLTLANLSEFNEQQNQFLIILSIGLLFIIIVIFVMYEMFIHEETRSVELSARLQRVEMETHFYSEIDAMYADMRTWRHDYKNNLTALRALAEHGETQELLRYIDGISGESERNLITLQTGNLTLDAVVSAKLWLAASRGIEVEVQAVYPEQNPIKDNDLCAIAGNLLDNAIEACDRMEDTDGKRFISFSLLMKKKNLVLTIGNSFSGEIHRESGRYLTSKDKRFHGIGLQYIDSIVHRYQGHVLREHADGIFTTRILLPLISFEDTLA